ncbi:hypothetical protein C2G38_1151996 [Gigaspora rosea]|uniref:Tyr recombinase domain-containing protein n=1 Tax=Gigaspora rosea TaxID=44941 RepID=A0A397U0J6_9GLOM|nr:hypothetical protein C2G38_1151996 [Gigaspora rosea]
MFKTICIESGINIESRNICNHSGRRTSIMELFNVGVPENTGRAISGHKSSGGYYAYAKPTDEHKRQALANVLNKLILDTPSNETAQDLIEDTNPEFNDNEDSPSAQSEDEENLSDVDLNNSVQNEYEFMESFILHKKFLKKIIHAKGY